MRRGGRPDSPGVRLAERSVPRAQGAGGSALEVVTVRPESTRAVSLRAVAVAFAAAVLASGCSLVLDDPRAFEVAQPLDAAPPTEDARPQPKDASFLPDIFVQKDARVFEPDVPVGEPDLGGPDARVERDAAVGPDVGPADAARPDLGVCAPGEEVCNGDDDDCDGRIDESDPRQCARCGLPGAGLCAIGAFTCEAGVLNCVRWLPREAPVRACDALDNDCDGRLDEAGEQNGMRTRAEIALAVRCGERADAVAPEAGPGCGRDEVGCGAVHPCVEPGCYIGCVDNRADGADACAPGCDDADPIARSECLRRCVEAVELAWLRCLDGCAAIDLGAARWSCAGGDIGPICVAADCGAGSLPQGVRCVPAPEAR